jgi:hypothetical protein
VDALVFEADFLRLLHSICEDGSSQSLKQQRINAEKEIPDCLGGMECVQGKQDSPSPSSRPSLS